MTTAGYVGMLSDFFSGVARYTGAYGTTGPPNNFVPGRENLAVSGETPPNGMIDDLTGTVEARHGGLFVDAGVPGRGHRNTMMYGEFREVGVGISTGMDVAGVVCTAPCDSIYIVTNFAHRSDRGPFLTGVAYDDLDGDGFYTPDAGEALGMLLVEVSEQGGPVGSTTTFASGGYSIALPVSPGYDVRFSGQGHDVTFPNASKTYAQRDERWLRTNATERRVSAYCPYLLDVLGYSRKTCDGNLKSHK